ncbi:Rieske (2Fe-2S) protein [Aureicoccus marinus]|uniref:Rieske (2Fe-2S) protein n=1 Tax=Aureicoccus marinus TaxID=754435 RepID=UPI001C615ED7|nr:Rieske (2Fe-2S) protein [Aureicoccus marinus]
MSQLTTWIKVAELTSLEEKVPAHALVKNTDLVIVKHESGFSVLYGRCLHRGALMSDGHIDGHNLICGVHGWDYRYDTGVSEYNNAEKLHKFTERVADGALWVSEEEITAFEKDHPQPFDREAYLGAYQDTHPEETEPYTGYIRELARNGLSNLGHHGFSASMGVDRNTLPQWKDIQFLPAQLATRLYWMKIRSIPRRLLVLELKSH